MSIVCDVYVNMAGNDAVADGTTRCTTTHLSHGDAVVWRRELVEVGAHRRHHPRHQARS
jgi:hypothetical protein